MNTLETEIDLETIFDEEVIASNAEAFYDEMAEEAEAKLKNIAGNKLVLTLMEYERLDQERTVSVYIFPNTPEIYKEMDTEYRRILKDFTSGSDFWDQWTAMKNVLEMNYLIAQEIFQV